MQMLNLVLHFSCRTNPLQINSNTCYWYKRISYKCEIRRVIQSLSFSLGLMFSTFVFCCCRFSAGQGLGTCWSFLRFCNTFFEVLTYCLIFLYSFEAFSPFELFCSIAKGLILEMTWTRHIICLCDLWENPYFLVLLLEMDKFLFKFLKKLTGSLDFIVSFREESTFTSEVDKGTSISFPGFAPLKKCRIGSGIQLELYLIKKN